MRRGCRTFPSTVRSIFVVHNKQTDLTKTTQIRVDLNGLDGDDLTLNKLVAQLNTVDGVSASLDARGRLVLKSSSPNSEFAFGDDTSGLLASLGMNTFFTGSTASDLGVSSVIAADPSKFAASRSGIDGDTQNAVALAGFADRLSRFGQRSSRSPDLRPTRQQRHARLRGRQIGRHRLSHL